MTGDWCRDCGQRALHHQSKRQLCRSVSYSSFLSCPVQVQDLHSKESHHLLQRGDAGNQLSTAYAENISESAPSVVGLPTTKQLLIFVLTTVLVWTSEPLLSLVDSAIVGTFASRTTKLGTTSLASVVQLAALGPATMLCDSSIFLTYFIGLAATNKLARASAKKDWKAMIEISSHSLGVSVVLGILVMISLLLFGEPLLKSIVGPEGAIFKDIATKTSVDLTGEVVHIALGYTWIRSISAVFAITGSTAQSLLLCVLDTPTVTLAVLFATVLNTVGDVVLVARNGWGVYGAAVATSFATIVSNTFLIWKGRSLIKKWRLALWMEKRGEDSDTPLNEKKHRDSVEMESATRQSEAVNEYLVLPFISLPGRDSLRSLILLAGPIFLTMVAKLVEFWNMTMRAGNFGLVSLACHNLLMRIFLFFAVFGDGLSQASQTFLPGLFVKKRRAQSMWSVNTPQAQLKEQNEASRSEKAYQVIRRLLTISTTLGAFISVIACYIAKNVGGAFTSNSDLVLLMSTASSYMGANLLLHPLVEMLEGTMIASRDMGFLLVTRGIVLALFLGTLRTSLSKFTDIWKTLLLFQFIKIVLFGIRAWGKTKSKRYSKI
eukprot:CCRYP_007028-RA/>CCRYP_007028-RA protein AED:0.11 eAED:0.12 QI:0/0/0/1/1/1/3/0/603